MGGPSHAPASLNPLYSGYSFCLYRGVQKWKLREVKELTTGWSQDLNQECVLPECVLLTAGQYILKSTELINACVQSMKF